MGIFGCNCLFQYVKKRAAPESSGPQVYFLFTFLLLDYIFLCVFSISLYFFVSSNSINISNTNSILVHLKLNPKISLLRMLLGLVPTVLSIQVYLSYDICNLRLTR